jgi:hypothetical protein
MLGVRPAADVTRKDRGGRARRLHGGATGSVLGVEKSGPDEGRGDAALRRVAEIGSGVVGAAVGSVIAGPEGALVGGAVPGAISVGVEGILARRARVRREAAAKMLDLSLEAAAVCVDDFVHSVERSLASERLTSAAIEASTEVSFERNWRR